MIESLPHVGPDDKTQDMSGQTIVPAVHSPGSNTQVDTDIGETQPSGSGLQLTGSRTQPSGSETQPSGSGSKSRKQKRGRSEATNELLEKMITMQKSSDQMMMSLEEKRMKIEERQMEIHVQMRREERQIQLQMLMQQNMTHPMQHYPMHSPFNFGSTSLHNNEFDPDETQDGL